MPGPAIYFFLTIENNKLVAKYDGTEGGKVTRGFKDIKDYVAFFTSKANEAGVKLEDLYIMASSSLDFPEEATNNPKVIELANQIRMGKQS